MQKMTAVDSVLLNEWMGELRELAIFSMMQQIFNMSTNDATVINLCMESWKRFLLPKQVREKGETKPFEDGV